MGQNHSKTDEIIHLLMAARAEPSADKSKRLLEQSSNLCVQNGFDESNELIILRSQAIADLAIEESNPRQRTERWNELLSGLELRCKANVTIELAEAYSRHSIRASKDVFCLWNPDDRRSKFKIARRLLHEAKSDATSDDDEALRLTCISALYRDEARFELTDSGQAELIQKSFKKATAAFEKSQEPAIQLELGLATWDYARCSRNDDVLYVTHIRAAERAFLSEDLKVLDISQLTLARFYRLMYRPLDACNTYLNFAKHTTNKRRMLRESYIYAEAAIQVYFAGYPESSVNLHCSEALKLVESARAAGYLTARLAVGLAYLHAIKSGVAAGSAALSEICSSTGRVDWEKALRTVTTDSSNPGQLLAEGFAGGIEQSGVWNQIGTYVVHFLEDSQWAEEIYRYATYCVDKRDPICATNLARLLVNKNDPQFFDEAQRLISRAQSFADPRFKWWRSVLADLVDRSALAPSSAKPPANDWMPTFRPIVQFKQLRPWFKKIERLVDVTRKEIELIRVFYEIGKLTYGIDHSSYETIEGDSQSIRGSLLHRKCTYVIGASWTGRACEALQLQRFANDIAPGRFGLFISMSGYSDAALEQARAMSETTPVLLMDKQETEYVVRERLNFDELLTRKKLVYDDENEAFHQVIIAAQVI